MTLIVPTSMRAESERAERSIPRLRVNSGDASIDRRGRVRNVPPILSYGFRPFFLLGSIYAAFAVPFWLFAYFGGVAPAGAEAIPDALWSAVDVLLVNGVEAERLSGMSVADVPAAVKAGEALRRRFGMPSVIVTLGGHGVVALDERGTHHLPAWPVPGRGMRSRESWPASWPAVSISTRPSRSPTPPERWP